jgi:gliding motility-associated-like protein
VKNTGDVQLNQIAVSDIVPAHTSYVSGGTYNSSNNTVSFTGINLAVGATTSYTFKVQVTNDLTGITKVSNQATVLVDAMPSTPTKPADPTNPNNPDPSCTDAAGCTTDIPVQGKFHIPNVITPNGDGYNDKFVIQGTGYDQLQVTIFNRWNNVVYQNQMYQNDWDGNGLNAGTYFYVVKALNKVSKQWEVYKGWLTILR